MMLLNQVSAIKLKGGGGGGVRSTPPITKKPHMII